jgi:hypothetical protein
MAGSEPKTKCRRGYTSVKAIDPRDGGEWELLLSDAKMRWVAEQGEGAAKELGYTVRPALLNITSIHCGVRDLERDIDEDNWLCYVATPAYAYDWKTGDRVPAWRNEVLLIFVTEERVIYGWYWCKCDPQDKTLPFDHRTRFRERVL